MVISHEVVDVNTDFDVKASMFFYSMYPYNNCV